MLTEDDDLQIGNYEPPKMIFDLVLDNILCYRVYSSDSDRSGSFKGYYSTSLAASTAAEGSGWYGEDGNVTTSTIYFDARTNKYYEVTEVKGRLIYKTTDMNKQILDGIKAKLNPQELTFLKLDK